MKYVAFERPTTWASTARCRRSDAKGEGNRPVEDLFDFLADPRNESLYNPVVLSAEKTTTGPIGVGTRFVQRARSFGRVGNVDIEVIS